MWLCSVSGTGGSYSSIFQNLFKSEGSEPASTAEETAGEQTDDSISWSDLGHLPVRSVMDDLSVMIQRGAEREYLKAELLQALKVRLSSLPDVVGSQYKAAINNQIIADCKKYCSMHLDAEELKVLWFD